MKLVFSIFAVFFLFLFTGCVNKENVYLESVQPDIKINSVKIVSMDSCILSITISNEGGFAMKKAEIIFEDITIDTIAAKVYDIPLSSEKKQSLEYGIKFNTIHHDYKAKAILTSEKKYISKQRLYHTFIKILHNRYYDMHGL